MKKKPTSIITDRPYICAPNIMDTPDYTTKTVVLDMTGKTVIKAGTPISADGKVANDETAIGILLQDCHACLGTCRGLVVISGRIKQDVAKDYSGVTISDEAKAALINITFTGDGARAGGGGGGKEDFIITLSGTTLTFPKTYNQLKAEYGNDILKNINVVIASDTSFFYPFNIKDIGDRLMVNYFDTVGSSSGYTLNQYYFAVLGDSASTTVGSNQIG